jgi:hypothetical protein
MEHGGRGDANMKEQEETMQSRRRNVPSYLQKI